MGQNVSVKIYILSDAFGEYKPAYGLNGYIVTVDECNYVERNVTVDEGPNEGLNETVRYLQEDRLFLLREYDILAEQVEVNIIISLLGGFHFRWSEYSVIEIGKAAKFLWLI